MSYPIIFLIANLFLIFGVYLGTIFNQPVFVPAVFVILGFVFLILGFNAKKREIERKTEHERTRNLSKRIFIAIGLVFIFFSLGILRVGLFRDKVNYLNKFVNQSYIINGRVVSIPEIKGSTQKFIFYINKIEISELSSRLNIKTEISLSKYAGIKCCNNLEIQGTLETAPVFEDFNYRNYLYSKGIFYQIKEPEVINQKENRGLLTQLMNLKIILSEKVRFLFPEPSASLVQGLILGRGADFSKEFQEKLVKTGTSHITAISGYNITLLIAIFFYVFAFLPRNWRLFATILMLIFFAVLVGPMPSVWRATLMGLVVLWALYIGRLSTAFFALIWVAVFMILLNPYILVYDAGFLLSFGAALGLILFMPIWENLIPVKNKILAYFKDIILGTLTAQLFILPIILYSFDRFPVISFVANVLILPVIPLITFIGLIILFLSLIIFSLSQILSFAIYPLIQYVIKIITFFSGLNLPAIQATHISLYFAVVYYLLIFGLYWRLRRYDG